MEEVSSATDHSNCVSWSSLPGSVFAGTSGIACCRSRGSLIGTGRRHLFRHPARNSVACEISDTSNAPGYISHIVLYAYSPTATAVTQMDVSCKTPNHFTPEFCHGLSMTSHFTRRDHSESRRVHGREHPSSSLADVIDPSGERIATHHPSVVGLQQFRGDVHVFHSGIEPQVIRVGVKDHRSLPNASPNFSFG